MPYCSLEEAWAPVSYPASDIYGNDNQSIYKNKCPEPKDKKMKYLARTNQRLAKHNGPINRDPNYKNQVLKYRGNERYVSNAEESVNNAVFNYDNQETPYTEYDRDYLYNNEKPEAPIHEINLRKKVDRSKRDGKYVDSLEKIIAEVENTKENFSDDDNTLDSNSMYKELSSELGDEKKIIKYLLEQNEKLKELLKKSKSSKDGSSGVFNVWDFVIVLILGIIMIIILDYVYRIAVKRSI